MTRTLRSELVLAALLAAAPVAAPAGEGKQEGHGCAACASKGAGAAVRDSSEAGVTLAEAPLLDQDRRPVSFPADVVGDRIVVVDFVFTSCTTICPLLSTRLARVQAALGERAGREVRLVTISIDPARDTPERLKAFGARFKAGPGWTWLTGEVAAVERVLKGMGASTARPADHAPLVLVGDGRTGRWSRFNGFPDPAALLAKVDEYAAARRLARAGEVAP